MTLKVARLALRLAAKFERIPTYRLRDPPWSFRACSQASAQQQTHRRADSRVSNLKTEISEAVKSYPVSFDHLYDSTVRTLIRQGFKNKHIVQIVTKAQRIVELHESLSDILCFWRTMFRSESVFMETISEHPELLYLRPEAVEERQKQLFTVFPNKDIIKLAETCPQAFIGDWDEIMEKVKYITQVMVISPEHIISSSALSYSLLHIKTRHQFMLCCGKYRTPKPKEVTTTNPPLDKIIGLPLRLYLNICGVSADEYGVFERLMIREQEQEKAEDSDDDELD
uniref:mTERF domain-containing protein, mitochondrial n=1 Tax=Rhipicephalus appendiculatus TaxID=34631 RepID=A0A131YNS6_RHIAP